MKNKKLKIKAIIFDVGEVLFLSKKKIKMEKAFSRRSGRRAFC